MSKHQAELSLPLPPAASLAACERAATRLGWRATRAGPTTLTCAQIAPMATGNPVTVEARLSATAEGVTAIALIGSNFGFGPFQTNYVKSRVEELRAAIAEAASAPPPEPAAAGARDVVVNGVRLGYEQVAGLERTYGRPVQDGAYWYDRATGAWGGAGGPTLGFIHAGLDLGGPLRADASGGGTGVFINGRELHAMDVLGLQQLGPVLPGRYWVDATGNVGYEGGMMFGNLWLLASQRLAGGASGGGPWAVYAGGGVVAGDGQGDNFAQFGHLTWPN